MDLRTVLVHRSTETVARRDGGSAGARRQVGSTQLRDDLRRIEDLLAWLRSAAPGPLGAADEQKVVVEGRWRRGPRGGHPVGGWDGLRKGYRGRFGMGPPPLLEALGFVELEHLPKNNGVRAR